MANKEALQQFHKDMISSAADRLFQSNGFEKTTMDDIAREADYSKATLYVYFKSKDEIMHHIVLKATKMLKQRIEAGMAVSVDALKQYKAICGELVKFSREFPFYFNSLSETIAADMDSRSSNPVLDEIYLAGEQNNELIGEVIKNGIQQGYFREDMPGLPTGFLFWMTLSGVIRMAKNKETYILTRMGMDNDAFLDFSFRTLIRAISKEGVNDE